MANTGLMKTGGSQTDLFVADWKEGFWNITAHVAGAGQTAKPRFNKVNIFQTMTVLSLTLYSVSG